LPGLLLCDFHTPNHRWVIAGSLAIARSVFTGLTDVLPAIDQLLAETIDIDEEGAYLERSIGVYDAVCARSLYFIAEHAGRPVGSEAADRNLAFDLNLLNGDGGAETGLSHRQDLGTRTVPLGLGAWYLYAVKKHGRSEWAGVAEFLWRQTIEPKISDALWMLYVLTVAGDPVPAAAGCPLPDIMRAFPKNKFWRLRRGPLAVTVFGDSSRLLHLTHGMAELVSVRIDHAYFGAGTFYGDRMEVSATGVGLHSDGRRVPRRPGYDMPTGRAVPHHQFWEKAAERGLREGPPAACSLEIEAKTDGLALRFTSMEALAGVAAQIALDFTPGGVWESDGCAFRPEKGQVIFLRDGMARMRYGADVIEFGPGSAEGREFWQMRGAEPVTGVVRVLIALETPVDHALTLRVMRGLRSATGRGAARKH